MEHIEDTSILSTTEFDRKDQKILRELFSNARQPYSIIAKHVRLSKESVAYRIQKMQERGLITGFNTVLDVQKLDFQSYFVHIRFQKVDAENEKIILSALSDNPSIAWVVSCIGSADVILKAFARDDFELDATIKGIYSSFTDYLHSISSSHVLEEHAVPFAFLYGGAGELHSLTFDRARVEVDALDRSILELLANNARISLAELSLKLKQNRDTIKYRITNLEKSGVIKKYRPDVWPKKLGYSWYFLSLSTTNLPVLTLRNFKSYVLDNPSITYYYRTLGNADLHVEIRVLNTQQLNEILLEIRSILKTVLRNYELQLILHEHKYTYFPECVTLKPKANHYIRPP